MQKDLRGDEAEMLVKHFLQVQIIQEGHEAKTWSENWCNVKEESLGLWLKNRRWNGKPYYNLKN